MEGEEKSEAVGKKREGAGENSGTFNYDQEVFTKRTEALQFCCARKSGPGCRILCQTITVHHYSAYSTASPAPDLHNWIFNETCLVEQKIQKEMKKVVW